MRAAGPKTKPGTGRSWLLGRSPHQQQLPSTPQLAHVLAGVLQTPVLLWLHSCFSDQRPPRTPGPAFGNTPATPARPLPPAAHLPPGLLAAPCLESPFLQTLLCWLQVASLRTPPPPTPLGPSPAVLTPCHLLTTAPELPVFISCGARSQPQLPCLQQVLSTYQWPH